MGALLLLLALLLAPAHAYPGLYVAEYANGCTDHPNQPYAKHGSPKADRCVRAAGGDLRREGAHRAWRGGRHHQNELLARIPSN